MRPIDADALRKRLLVLRHNATNIQCTSDIFDICLTEVSNAPTIDVDKTCKTCKYYLLRSIEYPCARCRRNNALIDEIREQQEDRWKGGTTNG